MGRPTVLIGYHRVVGLITEQNWAECSRTNFSGRDASGSPLPKVAAEALRALSSAPTLTPKLHGLIDIETSWPKTHAILKDAMRCSASPYDIELAEAISKIFMSSTDNESSVKRSLDMLNSDEREIFGRLMRY